MEGDEAEAMLARPRAAMKRMMKPAMSRVTAPEGWRVRVVPV